jgi:cyclase
MVKGRKFSDYRDTGDPVSAARIYNAQKADELMFLDIQASYEGRESLFRIIEAVSSECFMPLTVGGGVSSVGGVIELLKVGADKVLINSAAVENPLLIPEAVRMVGQQCIVAGCDVRKNQSGYEVFIHGGRTPTGVLLEKHLESLQEMGVGEILINSIDEDGMMNGYDEELLKIAVKISKRPVICCGGAGNFNHLYDAFDKCGVHAVACASLFHFADNNPIRARAFLKNRNIPVKVV